MEQIEKENSRSTPVVQQVNTPVDYVPSSTNL